MRDKHTTRTENILTRCTALEKEEIQANAKACGLSVSDYIRLVSLKAKIDVNITK
jgi:hypothetical protein